MYVPWQVPLELKTNSLFPAEAAQIVQDTTLAAFTVPTKQLSGSTVKRKQRDASTYQCALALAINSLTINWQILCPEYSFVWHAHRGIGKIVF